MRSLDLNAELRFFMGMALRYRPMLATREAHIGSGFGLAQNPKASDRHRVSSYMMSNSKEQYRIRLGR